MSARFDWYQATVAADVGDLLAVMEGAALDGPPRWEDMPRAPQGYGFARRLNDAGGPVAMVWWGGVHPQPHAVASGESAQVVAELLRAEWPGLHRCSRVDPCLDFAEPGAYDRIQGLALQVAGECKVSVDTRGDHLLEKRARTLYLGSPTSHTRVRVYEKADELRSKFRGQPERLASIPQELARLECQVRPKTPEAKLAAASASPLELMGSARWTRELLRLVSGLNLAPFEAGRPWRQADDDRAYAALLSQYGGMLKRLAGDLGSWDMLGRQIGHDWEERERRR